MGSAPNRGKTIKVRATDEEEARRQGEAHGHVIDVRPDPSTNWRWLVRVERRFQVRKR